ncbi:unnamed protein product [Ranitomeya imitator]|uniref:Uncharacterized protein n=1 Tax=Ranitomeya imitator TaxID=111125 RepID=A0ABN9MBM1_9NEOB|nr:unnamed protein product [Ranitomeya imitator]
MVDASAQAAGEAAFTPSVSYSSICKEQSEEKSTGKENFRRAAVHVKNTSGVSSGECPWSCPASVLLSWPQLFHVTEKAKLLREPGREQGQKLLPVFPFV